MKTIVFDGSEASAADIMTVQDVNTTFAEAVKTLKSVPVTEATADLINGALLINEGYLLFRQGMLEDDNAAIGKPDEDALNTPFEALWRVIKRLVGSRVLFAAECFTEYNGI